MVTFYRKNVRVIIILLFTSHSRIPISISESDFTKTPEQTEEKHSCKKHEYEQGIPGTNATSSTPTALAAPRRRKIRAIHGIVRYKCTLQRGFP